MRLDAWGFTTLLTELEKFPALSGTGLSCCLWSGFGRNAHGGVIDLTDSSLKHVFEVSPSYWAAVLSSWYCNGGFTDKINPSFGLKKHLSFKGSLVFHLECLLFCWKGFDMPIYVCAKIYTLHFWPRLNLVIACDVLEIQIRLIRLCQTQPLRQHSFYFQIKYLANCLLYCSLCWKTLLQLRTQPKKKIIWTTQIIPMSGFNWTFGDGDCLYNQAVGSDSLTEGMHCQNSERPNL